MLFGKYGLTFQSNILEEESGCFRRVFLLAYTVSEWICFSKRGNPYMAAFYLLKAEEKGWKI